MVQLDEFQGKNLNAGSSRQVKIKEKMVLEYIFSKTGLIWCS